MMEGESKLTPVEEKIFIPLKTNLMLRVSYINTKQKLFIILFLSIVLALFTIPTTVAQQSHQNSDNIPNTTLIQSEETSDDLFYQQPRIENLSVDIEKVRSENGLLVLNVTVQGEQPPGYYPWIYPVILKLNTTDHEKLYATNLLHNNNYKSQQTINIQYNQQETSNHKVEIEAEARSHNNPKTKTSKNIEVEGESSKTGATVTAQITQRTVQQYFTANTFVTKYKAKSGNETDRYLEDLSLPSYGEFGSTNITSFAEARSNNENGSSIVGESLIRIVTQTQGIPDSKTQTLAVRYGKLKNLTNASNFTYNNITITPINSSGQPLGQNYTLPTDHNDSQNCYSRDNESSVCVYDLDNEQTKYINNQNELFLEYTAPEKSSFALYCQSTVSSALPENTSKVCGFSGNVTRSVIIIPTGRPPIAKFNYTPNRPSVDESIKFNASNSTDPDGIISSYEWAWNTSNSTERDNIIYEDMLVNETKNHTYTKSGYYNVTLKVTDNEGLTDTTTKQVPVGENLSFESGLERIRRGNRSITISWSEDAGYDYAICKTGNCDGEEGPNPDNAELYLEPSEWCKKAGQGTTDISEFTNTPNWNNLNETQRYKFLAYTGQPYNENVNDDDYGNVVENYNAKTTVTYKDQTGQTQTRTVDVSVDKDNLEYKSNPNMKATALTKGISKAIEKDTDTNIGDVSNLDSTIKQDSSDINGPDNWGSQQMNEFANDRELVDVSGDTNSKLQLDMTYGGAKEDIKSLAYEGSGCERQIEIPFNSGDGYNTYRVPLGDGPAIPCSNVQKTNVRYYEVTVNDDDLGLSYSSSDAYSAIQDYLNDRPELEDELESMNGPNGKTYKIKVTPQEAYGASDLYTGNTNDGDTSFGYDFGSGELNLNYRDIAESKAIKKFKAEASDEYYNKFSSQLSEDIDNNYCAQDPLPEICPVDRREVKDYFDLKVANIDDEEFLDNGVDSTRLNESEADQAGLVTTYDSCTSGDNNYNPSIGNPPGGGGSFGGGGGGGGGSPSVDNPTGPSLNFRDITITLGDYVNGTMRVKNLDESQNVTSYKWNMSYDDPNNTVEYNTRTMSHIYDEEGTYTVRAAANVYDYDSNESIVLQDFFEVTVKGIQKVEIPENTTELQSRINNLSDGDTLYINKTYALEEPVDVNRSIKIQGINETSGIYGIVNLDSDGITVNDMNIVGSFGMYGDNITVTNSNITSNEEYAVFVDGDGATISNNKIRGQDGIYLNPDVSNVDISGNDIYVDNRVIAMQGNNKDINIISNILDGQKGILGRGGSTGTIAENKIYVGSEQRIIKSFSTNEFEFYDNKFDEGSILEFASLQSPKNSTLTMINGRIINNQTGNSYNYGPIVPDQQDATLYNSVNLKNLSTRAKVGGLTVKNNTSFIYNVDSTGGMNLYSNNTILDDVSLSNNLNIYGRNVTMYNNSINGATRVRQNNVSIKNSSLSLVNQRGKNISIENSSTDNINVRNSFISVNNSDIGYVNLRRSGLTEINIDKSELNGAKVTVDSSPISITNSIIKNNGITAYQGSYTDLSNVTFNVSGNILEARDGDYDGQDDRFRVQTDFNDVTVERGYVLEPATIASSVGSKIKVYRDKIVNSGDFEISLANNRSTFSAPNNRLDILRKGVSISGEENNLTLDKGVRFKYSDQSFRNIDVVNNRRLNGFSVEALNASISDLNVRIPNHWGIVNQQNRAGLHVDNVKINAEDGLKIEGGSQDILVENSIIRADDKGTSISDNTKNITIVDTIIISGGNTINSVFSIAKEGQTVVIDDGEVRIPEQNLVIPTNRSVYESDATLTTGNVTIRGEGGAIVNGTISINKPFVDMEDLRFGSHSGTNLDVNAGRSTFRNLSFENPEGWAIKQDNQRSNIEYNNINVDNSKYGIRVGAGQADATLKDIRLDTYKASLDVGRQYTGEFSNVSIENGSKSEVIESMISIADENESMVISNNDIVVGDDSVTVPFGEYNGHQDIYKALDISFGNNASLAGTMHYHPGSRGSTLEDAAFSPYDHPSIHIGDYNIRVSNASIANDKNWGVFVKDNLNNFSLENSSINSYKGVKFNGGHNDGYLGYNFIRTEEDGLSIPDLADVTLENNTILSGNPITAAIDASQPGEIVSVRENEIVTSQFSLRTNTTNYSSTVDVNTKDVILTFGPNATLSGRLDVNEPELEVYNMNMKNSQGVNIYSSNTKFEDSKLDKINRVNVRGSDVRFNNVSIKGSNSNRLVDIRYKDLIQFNDSTITNTHKSGWSIYTRESSYDIFFRNVSIGEKSGKGIFLHYDTTASFDDVDIGSSSVPLHLDDHNTLFKFKGDVNFTNSSGDALEEISRVADAGQTIEVYDDKVLIPESSESINYPSAQDGVVDFGNYHQKIKNYSLTITSGDGTDIGTGILIDKPDTTIRDVTIRNVSQRDSLYVQGRLSEITNTKIYANKSSNSYDRAVRVDRNGVVLENNEFIGSRGMYIRHKIENVSVDNNYFETENRGIRIDYRSRYHNIRNNTINSSSDAFYFEENDENIVNLRNNTINKDPDLLDDIIAVSGNQYRKPNITVHNDKVVIEENETVIQHNDTYDQRINIRSPVTLKSEGNIKLPRMRMIGSANDVTLDGLNIKSDAGRVIDNTQHDLDVFNTNISSPSGWGIYQRHDRDSLHVNNSNFTGQKGIYIDYRSQNNLIENSFFYHDKDSMKFNDDNVEVVTRNNTIVGGVENPIQQMTESASIDDRILLKKDKIVNLNTSETLTHNMNGSYDIGTDESRGSRVYLSAEPGVTINGRLIVKGDRQRISNLNINGTIDIANGGVNLTDSRIVNRNGLDSNTHTIRVRGRDVYMENVSAELLDYGDSDTDRVLWLYKRNADGLIVKDSEFYSDEAGVYIDYDNKRIEFDNVSIDAENDAFGYNSNDVEYTINNSNIFGDNSIISTVVGASPSDSVVDIKNNSIDINTPNYSTTITNNKNGSYSNNNIYNANPNTTIKSSGSPRIEKLRLNSHNQLYVKEISNIGKLDFIANDNVVMNTTFDNNNGWAIENYHDRVRNYVKNVTINSPKGIKYDYDSRDAIIADSYVNASDPFYIHTNDVNLDMRGDMVVPQGRFMRAIVAGSQDGNTIILDENEVRKYGTDIMTLEHNKNGNYGRVDVDHNVDVTIESVNDSTMSYLDANSKGINFDNIKVKDNTNSAIIRIIDNKINITNSTIIQNGSSNAIKVYHDRREFSLTNSLVYGGSRAIYYDYDSYSNVLRNNTLIGGSGTAVQDHGNDNGGIVENNKIGKDLSLQNSNWNVNNNTYGPPEIKVSTNKSVIGRGDTVKLTANLANNTTHFLPYEYEWKFYDGTTKQGQNVTKTYDQSLIASPEAKLIDEFGLTSTNNTTVRVDIEEGIFNEGFENGIKNWTVSGGFTNTTRYAYEGSYSGGTQTNTEGVLAEAVVSPNGTKPSEITFFYVEEVRSNQGGILFENSNGQNELGFETENPEWYTYGEGGYEKVHEARFHNSNTYGRWNKVHMTLNWSADKYYYRVTALDNGFTKEGTRNMTSGKDISKIKIVNEHGDSETWFDNIRFTDATVAKFNSSTEEATIREPVRFDARFAIGDANATYNWEFGDGSTGQGRLVRHNYSSAGSYDVTLTVTSDNESSSRTKTIKVKDTNIYYENFEDGIDTWTKDDYTNIHNSNGFNGSDISIRDNNVEDRIPIYDIVYENGGKPNRISLYFRADSSNGNGGGFRLVDKNNNEILGLGENNPQWMVSDGGDLRYVSSYDGKTDYGDYEWTRANISILWDKNKYYYNLTNMKNGKHTEGVANLTNNNSIYRIQLEALSGNNWNGGDLWTSFDDIKMRDVFKPRFRIIRKANVSDKQTVSVGENFTIGSYTTGKNITNEWNLGDGRTLTGIENTISYNNTGKYNITLHTYNETYSENITRTMNVISGPKYSEGAFTVNSEEYSVRTDKTLTGINTSGIVSTNATKVLASDEPYSENVRPDKFFFTGYFGYRDIGSQSLDSDGGGIRLKNSKGDYEIGIAEDGYGNIEITHNGSVERIGSIGNGDWATIVLDFDWSNDRVKYKVIDVDNNVDSSFGSGSTESEGYYPIKGIDIANISIQNYNSNEWSGGSTMAMWFENITFEGDEVDRIILPENELMIGEKFDAKVSSHSDTSWNMGDGTTKSGSHITHSYSTIGDKTITVGNASKTVSIVEGNDYYKDRFEDLESWNNISDSRIIRDASYCIEGFTCSIIEFRSRDRYNEQSFEGPFMSETLIPNGSQPAEVSFYIKRRGGYDSLAFNFTNSNGDTEFSIATDRGENIRYTDENRNEAVDSKSMSNNWHRVEVKFDWNSGEYHYNVTDLNSNNYPIVSKGFGTMKERVDISGLDIVSYRSGYGYGTQYRTRYALDNLTVKPGIMEHEKEILKGDSITFEASPKSPDYSYNWTIDNSSYEGSSVTYNPSETGVKNVSVEVSGDGWSVKDNSSITVMNSTIATVSYSNIQNIPSNYRQMNELYNNSFVNKTFKYNNDLSWSNNAYYLKDNIEEINLSRKYAFELKTQIYVSESGDYYFSVNSDEAADIQIDGEYVRGWYGSHGMKSEKVDHNHPRNNIQLEKGIHNMTVRLVNNDGESGLDIHWKTPSSSEYEEIPVQKFQSHNITPIKSNKTKITKYESINMNISALSGYNNIKWTLGEGTNKSGTNIQHTYDKPGVYNVKANAEYDNKTYTEQTTFNVKDQLMNWEASNDRYSHKLSSLDDGAVINNTEPDSLKTDLDNNWLRLTEDGNNDNYSVGLINYSIPVKSDDNRVIADLDMHINSFDGQNDSGFSLWIVDDKGNKHNVVCEDGLQEIYQNAPDCSPIYNHNTYDREYSLTLDNSSIDKIYFASSISAGNWGDYLELRKMIIRTEKASVQNTDTLNWDSENNNENLASLKEQFRVEDGFEDFNVRVYDNRIEYDQIHSYDEGTFLLSREIPQGMNQYELDLKLHGNSWDPPKDSGFAVWMTDEGGNNHMIACDAGDTGLETMGQNCSTDKDDPRFNENYTVSSRYELDRLYFSQIMQDSNQGDTTDLHRIEGTPSRKLYSNVPESAVVGEYVEFSSNGLGNVTWKFGDGSVMSGANVTKRFNSSGLYNVTVKEVYDNNTRVNNKDISIVEETSGSYPESCAEVLELNSSLSGEDGLYKIDADQDGNPSYSYCDMTTNGGGWTLVSRYSDGSHFSSRFGGDTGSVEWGLRSDQSSEYYKSGTVGSTQNWSSDLISQTYYSHEFDKMMFEDSLGNYISYSNVSGSSVSNWYQSYYSGVELDEKQVNCDNNNCAKISDGSYEYSSSNLDPSSVNDENSFDLRLKTEDGDTYPGHRNHNWNYGPSWPANYGSGYKWDDAGVGWQNLTLGGAKTDKSNHIGWFVKENINLTIGGDSVGVVDEKVNFTSDTRVSSSDVTWTIDGVEYSGREVSHTFTSSGNYTISITEEYNNESYTRLKDIRIYNEISNSDTLSAKWSFDNTTDRISYDSSSNNNNGYVNAQYNSGFVSSGLDVNGVDQNSTYSSSNSLKISRNITLSAWVNPDNCYENHGTVVTKRGSYYLQVDSDCSVATYTYHNSGGSRSGSDYTYSNSKIPTNEWSHIVFVEEAGTRRIYINGELDKVEEMEDSIWTNDINVSIGESPGRSGHRNFDGQVDEIRIHNSALSEKKIDNIYDSDLFRR